MFEEFLGLLHYLEIVMLVLWALVCYELQAFMGLSLTFLKSPQQETSITFSKPVIRYFVLTEGLIQDSGPKKLAFAVSLASKSGFNSFLKPEKSLKLHDFYFGSYFPLYHIEITSSKFVWGLYWQYTSFISFLCTNNDCFIWSTLTFPLKSFKCYFRCRILIHWNTS